MIGTFINAWPRILSSKSVIGIATSALNPQLINPNNAPSITTSMQEQ